VLFVLHLRTRRIVLAEPTFSPHGRWMCQMGRNLLMECDDLGLRPRTVVPNRDALLVHDLDVTLGRAGLQIVKTPFRAPHANAYAERWAGSVTGKCLDELILLRMGSLQRTLRIYRDFFNGHRPHQGIGNQIADPQAGGEPDQPRGLRDRALTVECQQFLGGLPNSYYRRAA